LLLRATSLRGWTPAILLVLWIALAGPVPAWSQVEPRGVLLINSYNVGYEWTDELSRGVRAGLEGHGTPIDLSVEFLDARRRGEELFPQMRTLLESRYSAARTAAIIAADDPALKFLLEHAPDLLASVPVIFCGVSSEELAARAPRSRFTGVREVMTVSPALDVAVSLHAPRRVFVVVDDTLNSNTVRHSLEAYARQQRGLQMVYLDGHTLSFDQILATLRRDTTSRDLLMTTSFTRDLTGRSFPASESLAQIAAASAAPTYSPLATAVGQGQLASGINAGFEHGLTTARLTMAVLRGRAPADVPIELFNRIGYQFDYRQLVRYGVDESRLPTAALIIGRPRSFYRENRLLIWVTTLFILGQTVVIAAFTRNVLRRRTAERELARTEAHLRQSQKMEAVGRLAGGIAHDFNNLLTVINGHTALLRELPEVAGREAGASLEEIQKAGNQAATLTRQLLAFSRKQVLQARVVNLNQVVRELESMLGRLIGERIALTTELDPDLLNLSVDPGQMQQAIVNLVVNARDAMPDGGRIVIGTRNADRLPAVADAHGRDGPCVVLTVSDTGQGMSPQTRAQIFEPFFTTKPEGKGTGLGLATVYGVVRQSGGWIDVASEVGEGTTFMLHFPATRETAGPLGPAVAPEGVVRLGASVLVVEDQPEVRELAVVALRRAGYEVFEASDGDEAAARFHDRASSLALLLTDVVMPGLNGRELAQRLRAANPDLLVIFMSGYAHEILDQQELVGPGTTFVAKPFTPGALVRHVDALLRSRQQLRSEAPQ
jgi:signal transduction histidine kinase/ActR/RegA family two-component response regulator